MDDTARAIAHAREDAVAEKADAARQSADPAAPHMSRPGKSGGRPVFGGGPAAAPSTKRPKHPGG